MSQSTSTLMQLIAIFLVLFATLLNLVYSLIVLVKGIMNIANLLKFRRAKNEISKKYNSMCEREQKIQQRFLEGNNNPKFSTKKITANP